MTASAAFDKLQAYLRAVDLEAEQLVPGHQRLEHIIRAYQGGPAPRGPYGLLTLQASTDLGEIDGYDYRAVTWPTGQTDPETELPITEERIIQKRCRALGLQFAFDVFASDATNRINRFRLALLSDAAFVPLHPFVVRDIRRVNSTGELIGEHWQGRAALIIEMAGIETQEFAVDVIESGDIEIDGKSATADLPDATLTYDKP